MTIGKDGVWTGAVGDSFNIYKGIINNSIQNTLWNTNQALLAFTGAGDHAFALAGADKGAKLSGYTNNFAWGTLAIQGTLYLSDGNTDTMGGAQYVNAITGALFSTDGKTVTNIDGQDGLNIYYLASDTDNAYLKDLTYNLTGGGQLIPVSNSVPIPGALWLFGSGLVGLAAVRRRLKK